MIARLRGETARGPSLFSQTLVDESDVTTFERATPEQEAFVRTMLEGVDPDIFKSETGLEKGVALPEYPPARITAITRAIDERIDHEAIARAALDGLLFGSVEFNPADFIKKS